MVFGMKKATLPTIGEMYQVQSAFSQITFWLRALPCSSEVDRAIQVIQNDLDHQEQLARHRAKANHT
jgi:hypothetical protein